MFCINEYQCNRQALIYDPTNGGKKEKGPRGRHAMQAISFPPTELQFRKAAEEDDNGIENVQT